MAHHERRRATSASSCSGGPLDVPRWSSTRLKRSRIEDHSSESSPIDQNKRQIPLDTSFTSSTSSELATSNVALRPCLPLTASFFQSSGQPNMNNPFVLDLYTRLVKFQHDAKQPEATFEGPDHAVQDLLHALARKLGLEFEYSLRHQRVCISRAPTPTEVVLESVKRDEPLEGPLFNDFSGNSELPSLERLFVPDEMNFHMSDIFPGNFDFTNQSKFAPELECFDSSFIPSRGRETNHGAGMEWLADEGLNGFTRFNSTASNGEGNASVQTFSSTNMLLVMDDPMISQQVLAIEHEKLKQAAFISQQYAFIQDSDTPSRSRLVDTAASKAVKDIGGACWKCKVLRKKCDTKTTCRECSRGGKRSIWQEVGCRRGPIDSQYPTTFSCPRDGRRTGGIAVQFECCESCERLHHELVIDSSTSLGKDAFPWTCCFRNLERVFSGQQIVHFASLEALCMSFVQEWAPYRELMEKTLVYLGLESMQQCPSRAPLPLVPQLHHECKSESCTDPSAQELELSFTKLLEALSHILFQKKNLQGDKSWWLPVFISLCLLGLSSTSTASHKMPAVEPLHLTARLFAALSSNFDPLRQDSLQPLTVSDIWLRKAVGFDEWEDRGIGSSADFLRFLFGMDDVLSDSLVPTVIEGVDVSSPAPCLMTTRKVEPVRSRRPSGKRDTNTACVGEVPEINIEELYSPGVG